MTNTFSNRQKYTIRQSAVTKNEKGMRTQLKARAIVLTIAFAVAAGAAVWVSALVKNRSAESHVSALPVAVNAGSKNTAPAVTQTAAAAGTTVTIFQSNGKSGNGYDWTYSADSGCAKITCDYDFGKELYTFAASGVTPGTDHVELMYKDSNDKWQTVSLTLNVDNSLNTTIS